MTLRPLDGFLVGVTADRRAGEQAELLRRRGARVVHGPAIATAYLGDDERLREATVRAIESPPTHLVALTGIGVRAWFEAAQAWGLDGALVEALSAARIVARGAKASAALAAAGLTVWRAAGDERSAGVLAALASEAGFGARIAVQRDGGRDDRLVAALARTGAVVVGVPVYRWSRPADDRPARSLVEAVVAGRVHAVTFTAAPAVENFFRLAGELGLRDAAVEACNQGVAVACVGPVCAEAAARAGVAAPVAPAVGRLGLMVRALADHLHATRMEVTAGGSRLVLQGDVVVVDGVPVRLGSSEAAALRALAARPGVVVPKAALLPGPGRDLRAVDVAVGRLRRKLGPAGGAVQTLRRRGYRLA